LRTLIVLGGVLFGASFIRNEGSNSELGASALLVLVLCRVLGGNVRRMHRETGGSVHVEWS